jgi:hypothetical protein
MNQSQRMSLMSIKTILRKEHHFLFSGTKQEEKSSVLIQGLPKRGFSPFACVSLEALIMFETILREKAMLHSFLLEMNSEWNSVFRFILL